jgi:hypothetical protein
VQWLRETVKMLGFKEIAARLSQILADEPTKGDETDDR